MNPLEIRLVAALRKVSVLERALEHLTLVAPHMAHPVSLREAIHQAHGLAQHQLRVAEDVMNRDLGLLEEDRDVVPPSAH